MVEDERVGREPGGGFLPPQPTGPEPDLRAPGSPQQQAPDHRGFLPPQRAAAHGYAAPPKPSQPPAWHAGSAPAGTGAQGQPTGWSHAPAAKVPDNGDALAGLILSISALTLVLLSVGVSSIISVLCAALGIYYSRKGRARVERGETPKHRGVAQAGFVTGMVALALSTLATILWAAVAILFATNEDFRQNLEDELDGDERPPGGFETAIPLGLAALRAVALLLG